MCNASFSFVYIHKFCLSNVDNHWQTRILLYIPLKNEIIFWTHFTLLKIVLLFNWLYILTDVCYARSQKVRCVVLHCVRQVSGMRKARKSPHSIPCNTSLPSPLTPFPASPFIPHSIPSNTPHPFTPYSIPCNTPHPFRLTPFPASPFTPHSIPCITPHPSTPFPHLKRDMSRNLFCMLVNYALIITGSW